jgi:hypothetical protein
MRNRNMTQVQNKLVIQQDIIVQLLAQLTVDYQNTKSERQEIAQNYLGSEEEFSFLEELELVTVSIRGYSSQIDTSEGVEHREEAIADLHQLRVFDRFAIAQFYDEMRSRLSSNAVLYPNARLFAAAGVGVFANGIEIQIS